ncbi:phage antirepressor KilAC domain-containing protein [Heyndrickxia oleronia]|uniref:phage antirepressor KilAC domain-containing protein n=1 Tax=Heyndrickxia oleronia TaxID=38875 RepID=UPI003F1E623C
MLNLAVKEVEFNGDTLIAAQDIATEKIYVGVRWVCEGIGLTRGQLNNEVKKVQEDIVLGELARNLVLDTGYGLKEVLCIELDGLPLWLAKISITPKMQKESPETVKKLVTYQIKAKDVLANAFIHNIKQIVPQTYKEALIALVESIEEKEKLEQENQVLLPKAKSFDTFIDGSNYQKMNDVAKALGYGRNKLYEFLREKKVLMKDNLPYQKYINIGYFTVKENPVKKGSFIKNHSQTFVSSKGVDFINKLLNEHNIQRIV